MADSPVKPDDFKAVIPGAGSNLCEKLLNALIKLPTLIWQFVSWMMKADGTPSDDFKAWLGVAVGQLSAPTNVHASDGTFTDHVSLTWDPVAGATYYEIFRSQTNDNSTGTSLGTSTTASFSDATVTANQSYWYFIKARNATDTSGFSVGESGFTDTTGGGGSGTTGSRDFSGNGNWTVPAGVATIQVEAWGASGGGGGSSCVYCPATTPFYSGGGGGSGEYLKVKTIPVTPGENLTIVIGTPGTGGGTGPSAGTDGGPSIIRRGSTDLVSALGGHGGGKGSSYGAPGSGGAGGSGGSASVGSVDTQTAGNAGTGGTSAYPVPAGGAGGAGVSGGAAGGAGGSNTKGSDGGLGKLKITWPSP